jgi:di- and tripeptidase
MLLGKGILPDEPTEEVLVSGGGDGRVMFWRIDPKGGAISEIYTLEDGREEGESILSLAQEGSFLYSGRLDGEVNVWDLETRQLVRSLKTNTGDVLTLSLGGGLLFAGGVDGVVQVRMGLANIEHRAHRSRNSTTITSQFRRLRPMTD